MKIIANKSILHNNTTGCTFIASQMDENVQTGTRTNDSHIEWMGNLNIPVNQHTAPIIEALEKATILLKKLDLRQRPSNNAISAIDRTIKQAETALLNAKQ